MRLINTFTLELEDHVESIPPYAILSHTWGDEEVTLQDWLSPGTRERLLRLINNNDNIDIARAGDWQWPLSTYEDGGSSHRMVRFGFSKILTACFKARSDGWRYLWVDTNCIDKTSSAELSEAINSMYIWYRNASVCYVYMSDVRASDSSDAHTETTQVGLERRDGWINSFRQSRWFRRGWTLQELLAPRKVHFHAQDWKLLGTKADMTPLLAKITRVDEKYLKYAQDIRSASVAQRMAAVADRTTTRPEDIAYCLLGLFNVNMPLLYGEGAMAFVRLQEEIMKVSDDHSIFAWTWIAELTPRSMEIPREHTCLDYKPNFPRNRFKAIVHNRMRRDMIRPTLLAPDPVCFFDASAIPVLKPLGSIGIFTMTNVGLSITLPILEHPCKKLFFAIIHEEQVPQTHSRQVIMIPLTQHYQHRDRWTRTSFPVAPVTVVFRTRSKEAQKLETIQVCRDRQHVPFYFDAFGGTSHRFGFWILFPQLRSVNHLGFHLDDGRVQGNGIYNSHGIFLDPEESQKSEDIGGLLILRVETESQDMWRFWNDKLIIIFMALKAERMPNGNFAKLSSHCRILIRPRAPVDASQLLDNFMHKQRDIGASEQSAYLCRSSFKQRSSGIIKKYLPLRNREVTLNASIEFLNDGPLSHSQQSEITLTELNLWISEDRSKEPKPSFNRGITV